MELEFFSKDFWKHQNIKFHENPSSGSRVVPCGRTDGQSDMTKLIFAFRDFSNTPKNIFGGKGSQAPYILWKETLIK
jgi:hypothetical protein